MADFNDVAVENEVAVVEEPVQGEVVNTEDTYEEGEKVTAKDVALVAAVTGLLVVGVVETTKKVIVFGKWAGGKIKDGFVKAKQKFGKKEAEVTEDVAEVTTEEVKAE